MESADLKLDLQQKRKLVPSMEAFSAFKRSQQMLLCIIGNKLIETDLGLKAEPVRQMCYFPESLLEGLDA